MNLEGHFAGTRNSDMSILGFSQVIQSTVGVGQSIKVAVTVDPLPGRLQRRACTSATFSFIVRGICASWGATFGGSCFFILTNSASL